MNAHTHLSTHCVGLSHRIPTRQIRVCGCNVTKCGKVQGIMLQGSVAPYQRFFMHFILESCKQKQESSAHYGISFLTEKTLLNY